MLSKVIVKTKEEQDKQMNKQTLRDPDNSFVVTRGWEWGWGG